jgi:hypothetical protein
LETFELDATRRVTGLTNAFSKKFENHADSLALYVMLYNFARIRSGRRDTTRLDAALNLA